MVQLVFTTIFNESDKSDELNLIMSQGKSVPNAPR